MKVDFIIAGAGIIGMTTALALCRSGKKVTIIEKNLEKSVKIKIVVNNYNNFNSYILVDNSMLFCTGNKR